MAHWPSSMILASGVSDPGFNFRVGPQFTLRFGPHLYLTARSWLFLVIWIVSATITGYDWFSMTKLLSFDGNQHCDYNRSLVLQ